MSEELLAHFVAEGRELAEAASRGLLAMERAPAAGAVIDEVFRAFHTLKGSAGIVGFAELGRMLHAAESRLDGVRRGEAEVNPALVSCLLEAVQHTERWLDATEGAGSPPAILFAEAGALEAALRADPSGEGAAEDAGRPGEQRPGGGPAADWHEPLMERGIALRARSALRYAPARDAFFRGDDPLALLRGTPGLVWLQVQAPEGFGPLAEYAPFESRLVFLALSTAPPDEVREAFRLVPDEVTLAPVRGAMPTAPVRRTLRVAADQVDTVGALVDDLIIARNALWHRLAPGGDGAAAADPALAAGRAALDRTLAALHEAVATLRLAPLGPLLGRVAAQARALAATLGKDLKVEVAGEDLAVDKAIMDGLFEPLLHLARNAVDHGVEGPAERVAAGKPASARLALQASAQGQEAMVELSDDGRGIDAAQIRRTAVARNLLDAEAGASLADDAVLDILFLPGFSTAGTVTEVSGRGVGLDAVRTAIARLGGRVRIETVPGRGTTVRVAVPLRAVLTRVVVAVAGGQRFGLPVSDIREVRRLDASEVTAIRIGRAIVHRDRVVPVARLAELLGLPRGPVGDETVLLVGEGDDQVAVAVESLGERLEAPVRPVWGPLATLPGIQGSLVEGDGRVLLVLSLRALLT